MRKPSLNIIEIEEEFQLKGKENIFNKIIKENFLNKKNDMTMKAKEAYIIQNRVEQNLKSPIVR